MDEQSSLPASRPGVAGLDIFKIAGQSISGFLPSWKTGDRSLTRQPSMSLLEARLAMHLEYHPHVRFYQRGDVSETFARARRLMTPLGAPYRIGYVYDGKPHDSLPDFVGTLVDGSLLIAEAGREDEKNQGQALAKAEAARRLAQLKGGVDWLGTDQNLSELRHNNFLYLHARRRPFQTYEEIATVVLANWPYGDGRSVNEFVRLFGSRWSEVEVEATLWKLVGDAMAQGRWLVDLAEVALSLSTPLALLEPGSVPILPDPLPSSLEEDMRGSDGASSQPGIESEKMASQIEGGAPAPTFDASVLETAEEQAHFHRNLAAVTAVLGGRGVREVAKASEMAPSTLSRLVQRTKESGQIACVPHRAYHRDPTLMHPAFQELIRQLYTHRMRPTIMAVYEDVRLKRLAEDLSEREGAPVQVIGIN